MIIIIIFGKPLYLSVSEVPNVINKSESITIGSLSVKIQNSTLTKPSPAVRSALKNISPDGIDYLLRSNARTEYFRKNEVLEGQQRYKELIKLGLYEEMGAIHLGADGQGNKYYYGVMPTDVGKDTRDYLIEILNGLVKEL